MLKITVIDISHVRVDMTQEGFNALKKIVIYADDNYDKTDLDHIIPYKAELRQAVVSLLRSQLDDFESTPFVLAETYISVLKAIIGYIFDKELEDVSPKMLNALFDEFFMNSENDFRTQFEDFFDRDEDSK